VGATTTGSASGKRDDRLALEKLLKLFSAAPAPPLIASPGAGCCCFASRQAAPGSPPFNLPRDAAEFFLHVAQLAQRDREELVGRQRDAFLELQLFFELVATEAERGLGGAGPGRSSR